MDKVIEHLVRADGDDVRIPEHVDQFLNAHVGQCGDGLVRFVMEADDRPQEG